MSKRRVYSDQLKGECIEMVVGLGMNPKEVANIMKTSYANVIYWVDNLYKGVNARRSHNTIDIITKTWKS